MLHAMTHTMKQKESLLHQMIAGRIKDDTQKIGNLVKGFSR